MSNSIPQNGGGKNGDFHPIKIESVKSVKTSPSRKKHCPRANPPIYRAPDSHQGNPPDLIQPPKHQNPPHLDPPCRHHYLEPYCHLCWRPLGPMAVSMGSYNWLKPYPPGPAGSGKRFIQWMRITRWLSMCFYQLILVHGCPNVSDTCLSCSPPVEGVEDVRIHLTIFFLDGLKPPSK